MAQTRWRSRRRHSLRKIHRKKSSWMKARMKRRRSRVKVKTTLSVMRSARHSEEAERLRKRGKNRAEILELGS